MGSNTHLRPDGVGTAWRPGPSGTTVEDMSALASAPPPYRRGRAHARDIPLGWRVFLVNAAILLAASTVLMLSPVTVSSPVAPWEAASILAGLALMLLLTLLLFRRAFAPLVRLAAEMQDVDLLQPGRRAEPRGPDAEVTALATAFNAMLDRLEHERRASSARAAAAQEDERRRVAQELHDEVGQVLTGVLLQSERAIREAPDDLRPRLEELRDTTRSALNDVRRIARELRPAALDDLGLASALNALGRDVARRSGIAVERRLDPAVTVADPAAELVVYRVAQESLTNVVRHAAATRAEVALVRSGDAAVLTVTDDGRGLPASLPPQAGGLRGMRERALAAGALLTTTAAPGGGTTVRLEVPLAA